MPTIYLVRHGQKISQPGDPGLTEKGIKQARETGLYLRQFPITKIISSPFKRTVETAQQIADALNMEYSSHAGLVERMNWDNPNTTFSDFFKEWVKSTNNRDYTSKYGDSSFATGERVHQLISEFSKKEVHLVLVTHGGAIIDYLRNTIGDEPLVKLRTKYSEGEDYQMMNCAISKIVVSDVTVLEQLNYTTHLTEISE